MSNVYSSKSSGFTIVELVIIIVIIAILAALSVVGYNVFTKQTAEASLQSNLELAASELSRDQHDSGGYPEVLSALNEGQGLPGSDEYDYTYETNGSNYCLIGTSKSDSSVVFSVTQSGVIQEGPCVLEAIAEGGGGGGGGGGTTSEACFAFNAGTKTITDYYDNESNNGANPACPRSVVIPTSIGGVSVEHIGYRAFYSDSNFARFLTAVTLPSTVKSIADEAFLDNSISSLTIPGSLETIGWSAFSNNTIVTLNIPVTVTFIDEYAFDNGTLTDVYMYSTTSLGGFGVFAGAQLHIL